MACACDSNMQDLEEFRILLDYIASLLSASIWKNKINKQQKYMFIFVHGWVSDLWLSGIMVLDLAGHCLLPPSCLQPHWTCWPVCLCTCPFHHQELGTSIEHSISTLTAMEDALMNYLMLLTLARLLLLGADGQEIHKLWSQSYLLSLL